jgi:hypothetical protein
MSWLKNLLGNRRAREEAVGIVVDAIRQAAEGAKTIAEIRERLARKAEKGDLDKAIRILGDAKGIAQDFVDNG